MKKSRIVVLLFFCCLLSSAIVVAQIADYPYLPTPVPDRIILNLTGQPESSMAATWRTDMTIESAIAELTLVQDGPRFQDSVYTFQATTELYSHSYEGEPKFDANYHSVVFNNLQPSTVYQYRVGGEKIWSEWFQFRTAGEKKDAVDIIYFGDAQNGLKTLWPRIIRESFRACPDADFSLYAGDLINRSGSDKDWGELLYSGGFIHATVPSIMTPGNHEYGHEQIIDPHWRKQFTLPENGPAKLEETCYFLDYQDIRLISIDADMADEIPELETAQADWLDTVLKTNDKKWAIVFQHIPFYSTKASRDNPRLRKVFRPIIEKYGVDIVLQGHDHAYGRGMKNVVSALDENKKTGTMYVVSVAGPKMYDVADYGWMTRRAQMTQLFQLIHIEGNELEYKSFTASGELYDAFTLKKKRDGSNKLIDQMPNTPEKIYK